MAVAVSDGNGETVVTRQQALRHRMHLYLEEACKDEIVAMEVSARFQRSIRDMLHFAGHDPAKIQQLYTVALETFLEASHDQAGGNT